ncbi:hypothetical protein [Streptomyces sp. AK02-04a]|uniref:hypothetical protein n=1 Tax=Streptomyces sp. AK02-04a TaxID=3028649 RepID=UPI0029B0D4BD|nr:hypothetical protein [Streptomyces sp. AK02-04a]MDX3760025.1 hypothetical protein [Streptomyces sp. AK02-04a]
MAAEVVGVGGHGAQCDGEGGGVVGVGGEAGGDLVVVLGQRVVAVVGAHRAEEQGESGGGGQQAAVYLGGGRAVREGLDLVGEVGGQGGANALAAVSVGPGGEHRGHVAQLLDIAVGDAAAGACRVRGVGRGLARCGQGKCGGGEGARADQGTSVWVEFGAGEVEEFAHGVGLPGGIHERGRGSGEAGFVGRDAPVQTAGEAFQDQRGQRGSGLGSLQPAPHGGEMDGQCQALLGGDASERGGELGGAPVRRPQ